jgi:hypothetical protein
MAEPPPYPDSDSNSGDDTPPGPERGSPPSAPRWVKVFGAIIIAAALLFLILHLTGHRHGGHTPHLKHGAQQPCS